MKSRSKKQEKKHDLNGCKMNNMMEKMLQQLDTN